MNESSAATKADAILLAILTHQPETIYKGQMTDISGAHATAETLAAFRSKLIEKLAEQPN